MLRPAIETDVQALTRLCRRSWLVSWAPELPFEAVQRFAASDPARRHVEQHWRSFTVATIKGEVLGVLQIVGDSIENIEVDPKAWGKGIGSALMDAAEREIAQGHATARLIVRSFNQRARDFYRRIEWIERRTFPGTECGAPIENVEMTKSLK